MSATESDRRAEIRPRAIKSGKLLYGFFTPTVIDCLVLEMSAGGARVETAVMINPPEKLTLRLGDGTRLRARKCWARGHEIGLEFSPPAVPAVQP